MKVRPYLHTGTRREFIYDTGLRREVFHNVRLRGTFTGDGAPGRPTAGRRAGRCCRCSSDAARTGPSCSRPTCRCRPRTWARSSAGRCCWTVPTGWMLNGIVTECAGDELDRCYRSFVLADDPHAEQRYYLTHIRRLGAQKSWHPRPGRARHPLLGLGAPRAQGRGGVRPAGTRLHRRRRHRHRPEHAGRPDARRTATGIWVAGPREDPCCPASPPSSARRTCSASPRRTARSPTAPTCIRGRSWAWARPTRRAPATKGAPRNWTAWSAARRWWTPSWSRRDLAPPLADPMARVPESEFWKEEFNHARPVPHRIEDLVIYELHVGSLGFGKAGPGTFEDAIALLDYLVELGVNAVELLPVAEFNGTRTWGYGNSHHFAVNASTGGRDQFRHFVRECHRRGHRRDRGRGLQPLRPRRRAGPVALRLRPGGAQPLLLVRGQGQRLPPAPTAATWTTCPAASPPA